MDKDLKNKTLDQLVCLVVRLGQKKYLAKYIFTFIHQKYVSDISEITTLSKPFRQTLTEKGYYISQLKTIEQFTDPDGTEKYLFELSDASRIETVLLFDRERITLCVSTQAGCSMKCTFCATAKIKLKRNLTAAEIADQVNVIAASKKITNIVFMGMGEPLANYENVLNAVRILNHPDGQNFGIRHITVSTCGLAPQIEQLAEEDIFPRLAISLNAPTDAIRDKIMPISKKYPLKQLLKAVEVYQLKTRKRVTLEYVMIKGLNDTVLHAEMLIKKLRDIRCNVNLIEYNPHPGCKLEASDKNTIERFAAKLQKADIETSIRLKRGQTIKAACGQLGADWLK